MRPAEIAHPLSYRRIGERRAVLIVEYNQFARLVALREKAVERYAG
jgi:hypothetical protein